MEYLAIMLTTLICFIVLLPILYEFKMFFNAYNYYCKTYWFRNDFWYIVKKSYINRRLFF
jgi:hypothetical protein